MSSYRAKGLTVALPEKCYNMQIQVQSLWHLLYIEPINGYKSPNRQKNIVTCWYLSDLSFIDPIKVYKGILAIKLITTFNVKELSAKKIVKSRKISYNKTNEMH